MTSMQTHPEATQSPVSGSELRRRLLSQSAVSQRTYMCSGLETAVLQGGAGVPLVLLHGPGEHAPKWLRVFPDLVAEYRVIAPDLPGHGETQPIVGAVRVDAVLSWLDDVIEKTCDAAPVLVGQIIGGAIAARYASRHGDRLRALVLSDSLGFVPFQPTPEFGAALMAFVSEPSAETHDQLWLRCASDLDRLRAGMGDQWDGIRAYNLDRARTESLRSTQGGLMEQFGFPAMPASELARIQVPTSLIWGRHDLATALEVAEAASTRYGWPLYVIEEAADDPAIEQPAAFVRALRAAAARARS